MKQIALVAGLLMLFISGIVTAETPVFRWGKSAGGTDFDVATSIAVDGSGNSYVAGYFLSPTITFGAVTLTNASVGYDGFVVKYDANGAVIWAKRLGGTDNDIASSIAVDAFGNSYVTGYFISSTIIFGTTTLMNLGGTDFYVVKYDASGNVVWAKSAGGANNDKGNGITVDASGNCWVTGYFYSPAITFGTTPLVNGGVSNQFVVKYDANGNVIWARSAGGSSDDVGNGIAADLSGNCYVTGTFASATMVFSGATSLTNSGSYDTYVAKYNAIGNVVWARSGGGGTLDDYGNGIAVDASGNSYSTGLFGSPTITFGSTTLTKTNGYDVYVVKYDANGNALWARSGAWGANDDLGNGIAVDTSGNSYVTGVFRSPTLTFGATTLTSVGSYDLFVVKYNASGTAVWAKSAGGPGEEAGFGIAVDASGNSYLSGRFTSGNLTVGATNLTNAGSYDMFVLKISIPPAISSIRDVPNDQGGQVRIKWNSSSDDMSVLPAQVTSYSIWRKSAAGAQTVIKMGSLPSGIAIDTTFISYDYVVTVPAVHSAQYQTVVPTLADSTSSGIHRSTFLVVAQNTGLNDYTVSLPDSGYSVDNLPPVPPAGIIATIQPGPQVKLTWNAPTDPDVKSYTVYRSATSGFTPVPGNSVGTTATTSFVDVSPDAGVSFKYRVVAIDLHDNNSLSSAEVTAQTNIVQQFSVQNAWNLISVPLTVADYSVAALFASATSEAFAYQGSYTLQSVLTNGVGYWLRFNAAQNINMTGTLLATDSITVTSGWNLVGSISQSIPVAQVTSIPPGIVTSQFFGYNGGYTIAGTIDPGKAYWVKVGQAGKLVLSSGGSQSSGKINIITTAELPPMPPGENSLRSGIPAVYALEQNYPNPFNPTTSIRFDLPVASNVSLRVYNVLGREVRSLLNNSFIDAGEHALTFDGAALPSGIYFYRLVAVGSEGNIYRENKKMQLLK